MAPTIMKSKSPAAKTDAELLDKVNAFYEFAESGNGELRERMATNLRYVCGDQWDPADVEWNRKKGKFSLTIPLIRPQVKFLVGQVVQNPKDITILNQHGGMKQLADLQTALVKHALSDQSAQFEFTQWFEQGVNTAAGYLGAFVEFHRDPLYGDLTIKALDSFDVLGDPACKVYDWNSRGDGAKFVIWEPWVDMDLIRAQYPDHADEIGVSGGPFGGGIFGWVRSMASSVFGLRERSVSSISGDVLREDYSEFRRRVRHCWWTDPQEVWYFYALQDEEEAEPLLVIDEQEKRRVERALKEYPDTFEVKAAIVPVVNHTISCGDVLLENRVDECNLLAGGEGLLPVIPFYPYHDNGYKSTVVDDLTGTQDLINYGASAEINLLKGQANRGWFTNGGTEPDKDWLRHHGSEDGVVIDTQKYGGQVQRIEPANMSVGYRTVIESYKQVLREISNIRTEQPEKDQQDMSGRAIALKQQASVTGVSGVLNNYDYSLHLAGNYIATVIRATKIYSLREIRMIVEEKRLLDPQLLAEMRQVAAQMMGKEVPSPYPVNQTRVMAMPPEQREQYVGELESLEATRQHVLETIDQVAKPLAVQAMVEGLRNPVAGRYYASVSLSSAAPTARFRQFAETMEVNQALREGGGPGLPPDVIVEASDLPNKEKVLSQMGAA